MDFIALDVNLQAHLPSVTDLCVHTGADELELDGPWQDQVCDASADWPCPCHGAACMFHLRCLMLGRKAWVLYCCAPACRAWIEALVWYGHRRACAPLSMRWAAWCSAACCPACAASALAGGDMEAGAQMPRPHAAPHVETVMLPGGRRPPGQLFWVTDEVLPDLHTALGVRADYDWERRARTRRSECDI